ncbi:MAG: nucleotide sugar dehydrogenase [Candidatus Thermoplasmatota archaeon]|nr:nucleotide sugar dehydrogenase [Candidatus Thermoplasmatota archaeon]
MIGLGYIGLPNALILARNGNCVLGVDIKEDVIEKLNAGIMPFDEPGLEKLFMEAKDNFRASLTLEHCDVYIIAVPTPLDREMKMADLKAVKAAAKSIATVLKEGDMVILESTVQPGTSRNFVIPILKRTGVKRFSYAHCPERAIPGKTLTEMVKNDRIIGGMDEASAKRAHDLYSTFIEGNLFLTDVTTAEFVKLMENTFRDINIALANEFALISEDIGVNVWEAIELANKHPRVNILKPGPGVGGHCIAIDPWFMVVKSTKSKIINVAREINDFMAIHVLKHIKDMIHGIEDPKITILGLAYKANVDDVRESPAFRVASVAENEGIDVVFHDPLIEGDPNNILDLNRAIEDSDCLVLITDHDAFKELDPRKLLVRHKNIIDTRNVLDHAAWMKAGFNVKVLGNGNNISCP